MTGAGRVETGRDASVGREAACRVLVIDDDDAVLKLTGTVLKRAGYEVVLAHDGYEGLKRHAERPAEVVVTDILMPGMEGIATIMALRRLADPPRILAMSGGGTYRHDHYLAWALALGADATIAKPFRIAALIEATDRLAGRT